MKISWYLEGKKELLTNKKENSELPVYLLYPPTTQTVGVFLKPLHEENKKEDKVSFLHLISLSPLLFFHLSMLLLMC